MERRGSFTTIASRGCSVWARASLHTAIVLHCLSMRVSAQTASVTPDIRKLHAGVEDRCRRGSLLRRPWLCIETS